MGVALALSKVFAYLKHRTAEIYKLLNFSRRPRIYREVSWEFLRCFLHSCAFHDLLPSPSYFDIGLSMEELVHTPRLRRSPDEKDWLERPVTPYLASPTARVTQFLSRKFLTWGVEERGE
jgi:hypothetical protein